MFAKGSKTIRRANALKSRVNKTPLHNVSTQLSDSVNFDLSNGSQPLFMSNVCLNQHLYNLPKVALNNGFNHTSNHSSTSTRTEDVDTFVDLMGNHLRADLRSLIVNRSQGSVFQRGLYRRAEDNAIRTASIAMRAALANPTRSKTTFSKVVNPSVKKPVQASQPVPKSAPRVAPVTAIPTPTTAHAQTDSFVKTTPTKPADNQQNKDKGDQKKGGKFFSRITKTLAAVSALMGGVYVWNHYIDPVVHQDLKEILPIIEAPPAFKHPLNSASWWYQSFFWLTRMCFLLYVFTPLVYTYASTHLFGRYSPENRQHFLECLIRRLERAGCSFLKFGQWLSMRPDMFDADIISALSKLRDNSPSHSLQETYDIVLQQFGVPVGEIFEEFTAQPIASGSIAQVYRAKLSDAWMEKAQLRNEKGELMREVAVKVRHPAVVKETWMDVDLIFAFIKVNPLLAVPFSKEEFGRMMQKQVDFRWEGHYLTRFLHNFSDEVTDGHLRFPCVSPALMSEAVLVESWAEGSSVADIFTDVGKGFLAPGADSLLAAAANVPLSPLEDLQVHMKQLAAVAKDQIKSLALQTATYFGFDTRKSKAALLREGEDDFMSTSSKMDSDLLKAMNTDDVFDIELMTKKKKLAFTLFDLFLKMFLRDNLIHGDLHAGNVLFNQATSSCTILDVGMTVTLSEDVQVSFSKFLHAICAGDPDALVARIQEFEVNRPGLHEGSGHGLLATDPKIHEAFSKDINNVCEAFFQRSKFMGLEHKHRPANVSIGDVVGQVLMKMQSHGIMLRGDVAASIMAMSVCEGLIRQLDPTLDIVLKSLPYFVKYNKTFSMPF